MIGSGTVGVPEAAQHHLIAKGEGLDHGVGTEPQSLQKGNVAAAGREIPRETAVEIEIGIEKGI